MSEQAIRKVGIITKHTIGEHPDHLEYLRKIVALLTEHKKEILFDEYSAAVFKGKKGYEKASVLRRADMAIVLGGDGTLLKTAHYTGSKPTLIAGVNMGNIGFLTEFTPKKIVNALPQILARKFCVDERFLLRVTVYRNNKKMHTNLALNEAVINQGGFARLINLHVEVNQRLLATYKADGLIISTPTGSTGHSLSSGGPIIHPKIDGMVLTPICPLKLGVRPLIIPNNRQITIKLETQWRSEKKPIVLTIDGQVTINLKRGDLIRIRESSRSFRMIRMGGHNYYRMLRKKLGWGD